MVSGGTQQHPNLRILRVLLQITDAADIDWKTVHQSNRIEEKIVLDWLQGFTKEGGPVWDC